jgi:predicted membrane protein
MAHNYYDIIIQGLPLVILLAWFGTIRQKNIKIINVGIFSLTIVGSIISFIIMVSLIF